LRYITIDIVRNNANLKKILGPILKDLNIKQSNFKQGNLHLLNSLSFEGHMMGIVTMSLSLNRNDYSKFDKEINRILLLINNEIN